MDRLNNYTPRSDDTQFHSVATVQLGELINAGFIDWNSPTWRFDSYNDEQYERLCEKIEGRFWFREISILPPGNWKRRFISKINEIMPKYKMIYKILDNDININQSVDTYYKGRNIFSEFPQTQLSDNQDYASSGNDAENETVSEGNPIEAIKRMYDYDDVDVMILDELEDLFSCLITLNYNGF